MFLEKEFHGIGYHYCSLRSFLSIIENQCFYMTDPLKANDSNELRWYLEKLRKESSVLKSMKLRSGVNFSIDEFINYLIKEGQHSIYIACFSKNKDLLSQWRAYADDGMGVSIGFDLDMLAKYENILVEEIKYTDSIIQNETENDIEIVSDTIQTILDEHKITDFEDQKRCFLHELIPCLAQYKNPSFQEEQEVRLIYCDDPKFEMILSDKGAFREAYDSVKLKHKFRPIGRNDIQEYVKLKFIDNAEHNAIKEICIGPKCALTQNDIERIFSHYFEGLHIPNITISKASYK